MKRFNRLLNIILRKLETERIKATSVHVAVLAAAPFHEIGLSAHSRPSMSTWRPDAWWVYGGTCVIHLGHEQGLSKQKSALQWFCGHDLDLIWRFLLNCQGKIWYIHTYIHAYRQTDRQTYIHTHISITHQTCSGKPRTCEITTQEKVHPLRITDVKITWLCTSVLLVVKGNSNNLLQSF